MVMLGARREERLYKIADEINTNGGRADFRTVDVTKPATGFSRAAMIVLASWMLFLTTPESCLILR